MRLLTPPRPRRLDHWWLDAIGLPGDFIRDIGALIRPNTSVLLVLLRTSDHAMIVDHLRDAGATFLHWPLGCAEDAALATVIADVERQSQVPNIPSLDLVPERQ